MKIAVIVQHPVTCTSYLVIDFRPCLWSKTKFISHHTYNNYWFHGEITLSGSVFLLNDNYHTISVSTYSCLKLHIKIKISFLYIDSCFLVVFCMLLKVWLQFKFQHFPIFTSCLYFVNESLGTCLDMFTK